jgi:type II secretory pathway pseudopilin PulG
MVSRRTRRSQSGEKGYMLLAVMLAMTLLLLAMAVEAPRIAQQIKREKEEELVHRGKDYATAIKRFVHKNGGRYPVSVEQLEDTNHIRFLRKRYKDPITGESNWRLVRFGEAEIKIPASNPGLNPSGNPGLSGSGNPGLGGSASGLGGPSTPAVAPTGIAPVIPAGGPGLQAAPANPQPGNAGQLGSLATSNIGNGQTIGGGQIIGVASVNKGKSIKEFNEKDHYDEWFFVYDLRLEQTGGTGVTVAAPRGGSGNATPGLFDQPLPGAPGAQKPGGTSTPPPQVPK